MDLLVSDLAVDSSEWKQVAKGNFVYEGVNPIYVNLKRSYNSNTKLSFVATSSNNGAKILQVEQKF